MSCLTWGGTASAQASPPSIEGESVAGILPTDATLEAKINPENLERGADYQFQIVRDASEYLLEFACPTEGFPAHSSLCLGLVSEAGALPIRYIEGASQSVSLDLAGAGMNLEPETTYHYRVIAATAVQTVDTIDWEDPIVDGADRTFTTPPAVAGAPVIMSTSVSDVTEHDATLNAQIYPGSLETTYAFHLTSPACQHEWPVIGPCMAIHVWSLPGGSIPAGFDDRTVSLDLANAGVTLQPGTWYEYAVTASNADGQAPAGGWEATQQSFQTPTAGEGPPSIDSESASDVTEHDATLEAQINPHDRYTGYEFQINTDGSYNFTQPNCPFSLPGYAQCESIRVGEPLPEGLIEPQPQYIPASLGDRSVSIDLARIGATLQPATTYHYRVIAANGTRIEGPDQTFTTSSPSSGDQPSQGDGQGASGCSGNVAVPPACAVKDSYEPSQPPKPQHLTRAQEFAKALKACSKKPKRDRAPCKKQARRRYGPRALKVRKR